ncbi:MAG TPA: hypothetical protein VGK67_41715 [Myxococcales bacterium]
MRTTLTLEPDLAAKLKEFAHQKRISFKEAVDTVLRRGFAAQETSRRKQPYRIRTFKSGLRPGIDPTKLGRIADELEDEELLGKQPR